MKQAGRTLPTTVELLERIEVASLSPVKALLESALEGTPAVFRGPIPNVEQPLQHYELALRVRRNITNRRDAESVERMTVVWARLYERLGDARLLNAALKGVDVMMGSSLGYSPCPDLISAIEPALQNLSNLPPVRDPRCSLKDPARLESIHATRPDAQSLSTIVFSGPHSSFTNALVRALVEAGIKPKAIIVDRTDRLAYHYGTFYRYCLSDGFYDRYGNDPGPWYRPAGREPAVSPSDTARDYGLALHPVDSINGSECRALIARYRPDICVLSGVGRIDRELIALPPFGMLNTHSGILPYYRGLDAVAWSMLEGFSIGCTIHVIDQGVDTGDILATYALSPRECMMGVKASLKRVKARMVVWVLDSIARGVAVRFPQAETTGRKFYRMHPILRFAMAKRYEEFGLRAFAGNIHVES